MGLIRNIGHMGLKIYFWSTFGATCHNNETIGKISGHLERYLKRKMGKMVSSTTSCIAIYIYVLRFSMREIDLGAPLGAETQYCPYGVSK